MDIRHENLEKTEEIVVMQAEHFEILSYEQFLALETDMEDDVDYAKSREKISDCTFLKNQDVESKSHMEEEKDSKINRLLLWLQVAEYFMKIGRFLYKLMIMIIK